MIYLSTAIG